MSKKLKSISAAILATFCIGAAVCLSGCSLFYDLDDDGVFAIGYKKNDAFIGVCRWYGGETVIQIPDDYNGIPITTLGGYFGRGVPCPFRIDIEDRKYDWSSDAEWVEIYGVGENVQTLEIVVKLGKNIQKITYASQSEYYGIESGDESNPVYEALVRLLLHFEVDEGNAVFYSENGRLYYRDGNVLVDEFIYE